jgi:protein tyrosine/serine phosphatase
MAQQVLDPRELTLEGSVNFRDLGGMATATGGTVKDRHVFRSDALHGLTTADLDLLADYGISLLVDLRDIREIERSGPSPLLERGTRHLHTPLMASAAPTEAPDPSLGMEVLYGQMLERAQPRFGEIFQALAEESNLPAVIHCAAGKDRTGVTVALLLRLLEVPDETIVLDYAISDRNMARLMERLAAAGYLTSATQYPAHYNRAAPETMERFLQALDATFGSAADYLAEAGLSAHQAATIRTRLVDAG